LAEVFGQLAMTLPTLCRQDDDFASSVELLAQMRDGRRVATPHRRLAVGFCVLLTSVGAIQSAQGVSQFKPSVGVKITGPVSNSSLSTVVEGTKPVGATVRQPEWLTVVNLYRATAGLSPVVEDPVASSGAKAHSNYLVKNRTVGHTETVGAQGYSLAGVRSGATGNVASGTGQVADERLTIEGWMTAPFHALSLLDRAATAYGYGVVGDGKYWASSLSVAWNTYRDPTETTEVANKRVFGPRVAALFNARPELAKKAYRAELRGNLAIIAIDGRRFSVTGSDVPVVKELLANEPDFPTVVWPGDGSAVPLVRFAGVESPDPLTSCPGWTALSGLPLLIHRPKPTEVISATLTDGNRPGPKLCSLTALTYVNPKPLDQAQGRALLLPGNAILLPKAPLVAGHLYRVQVVLADGEHLDWHFAATTDGAIKPPLGHVLRGTQTPGRPSQVPGVRR
jgi:Cysteine-rich secretory protein family